MLVLSLITAIMVTPLPADAQEVEVTQQLDTDVPPGNPVVGSDAPGDTQSTDATSYGLLALLAVCLIGAGALLVKVERWERHRVEHPTRS